jgi:hypothetical protein
MSSAETDAFVWEQTLRGLDRQATVLSELRQRASIVLSATGITTSLLGATALQDGGLDVWVVAALAVTTIGILLCVWVLKPVRDTGDGREWRVTVGGEELRGLLQGELQLPDVLDTLITARTSNFATIAARSRLFVASCALLPVQIVCWAAALG